MNVERLGLGRRGQSGLFRERQGQKREPERDVLQGSTDAQAPRTAALGSWPQSPMWPFISLVSPYNMHPQSKGKELWPGKANPSDVLAKTRAFLAAPGHFDLFEVNLEERCVTETRDRKPPHPPQG